MHPPVFFVRAGKMAAAQILSVTKLPARRYNKAREKVMHMRDIGKNIRDARVNGGITQDQLAERLHVSRQTISHYETGHTRPDIEMLEQIAQALDVDMTILLYGPPPRPDRQREIRRLAMGAGITAFGGIRNLCWPCGRPLLILFSLIVLAPVHALAPLRMPGTRLDSFSGLRPASKGPSTVRHVRPLAAPSPAGSADLLFCSDGTFFLVSASHLSRSLAAAPDWCRRRP